MSDNTWELVGLLTCGLILLVWALHALVHGYVARHRERTEIERYEWEAPQDFRRRQAERGASQVWNGHE